MATSNTQHDDLLAWTAAESGIRVYRGSLDNVLERFLDCTTDLADDDVVVRATADNPVPDGEFVDQLIDALDEQGVAYLGTSSPEDGLPYGLSAEVFTAGALREAAAEHQDTSVREHVTPHLRRKSGAGGIVSRGQFFQEDLSELRVTIDTLEDYLRVARLFRNFANPEKVSWRRLIDRMRALALELERIPSRSVNGVVYGAVTLGTAQLGLDYGITNRTGRPPDDEACAILSSALEAGVTHLDTARAYGDSEIRIGQLLSGAGGRLCIMSKVSPLTALPDDAPQCDIRNAIDASVYGSCRDLRRFCVDVLMFHRSADMWRWDGAATAHLATHVERGTVGALGVSVYSPDEAASCIADPRVTHIQIPFNLLDHRWVGAEFQQALSARSDLKVHARSVFLQGLLLGEPSCWPQWAHEASRLVRDILTLVKSLGRKGAADLCMAYVRSFPWVTSLVLGVETAAQLQELLILSHQSPLKPEEAIVVRSTLRDVPERLLNPALW